MSSSTQRLYYNDSYLRTFQAMVLDRDSESIRVTLDQTAFYPTSGGQPYDLGTLCGIPVVDVIDEDDGIVHVLAQPLSASGVEGAIDWNRRFDHMQQHTGQHVLSAVFEDLFGIPTVSFHMGSASSTIDLAIGALDIRQLESVEARANGIVHENRSVRTTVEEAETATGLRKRTERSGAIRIVTIESLDRSACGGTHVRATGEIGAILLRSVDKIRGNVRLEFVCGGRAIRRARLDYNALDSSAKRFSAAIDEVPLLVATTLERLKDADKLRRRLEGDLAAYRGRALYSETNPNERGFRVAERVIAQGPFPEDLRNQANSFVAGGRAIYIAVTDNPASILIASSADANVHCGNVLKQVLVEFSGRGGGSANLAQGSFTGEARAVLARVRELLLSV